MKREQITEIFPDATKEQIDKLMGINGTDINSAKGDLDGLKGQLTAAQAELAKLKEQASGPQDALKDASAAIKALQTELDTMKKAEAIRTMREKISTDKKIPASLLTGETEEACSAQADAILAFAKTAPGYPHLPDGGEPGGAPKTSTRDKFADWAKENL
jgi:chromosome segregation ATPase